MSTKWILSTSPLIIILFVQFFIVGVIFLNYYIYEIDNETKKLYPVEIRNLIENVKQTNNSEYLKLFNEAWYDQEVKNVYSNEKLRILKKLMIKKISSLPEEGMYFYYNMMLEGRRKVEANITTFLTTFNQRFKKMSMMGRHDVTMSLPTTRKWTTPHRMERIILFYLKDYSYRRQFEKVLRFLLLIE